MTGKPVEQNKEPTQNSDLPVSCNLCKWSGRMSELISVLDTGELLVCPVCYHHEWLEVHDEHSD